MDSYSRNKPSTSNSVVDNEVARLLKKNKGVFDATEFLKLRQKYDSSELVDKIQTAYLESYHRMVRKAKKFAHYIREKYGNSNYPFSVLLEKAHAFKKKAGLSDVEFAEFKRIYEQDLAGTGSPDVLMPSTLMMKTLGAMPTGLTAAKMKVSPEDSAHMEHLLKSHADNKPLHAQVLLQSIQYKDCDYEALTGPYRRDLGNKPGEHIHPVVAALFFPKIDFIEQTFLHSNMAGIVKSRYNDEPLVSRPDYELFYHLTMDPNDVVCSTKSPIADLKHRSNVQHQLWNAVLHLRNGQYYGTQFREFITAVDMCKLNKHDNPDLVYGRYDGTVMKRLLAAFSFRPTVIATHQYMMPYAASNPYNVAQTPKVMSIQMFNMKLPAPFRASATPAIGLSQALQQTQFFFEGGMIVPRLTDIIYSRGILVFYVDRRANVMRIPGVRPLNFHTFPTTLAGFERLNNRSISFNFEEPIRDDKYTLRSVVLSEVNSSVKAANNANIVVGSSTIVRIPANPTAGVASDNFFHYHPYGVVDYVPVPGPSGTTSPHNDPVTQIHGTPGLGPVGESFTEMAQERGIIFIYENTTDNFGENPELNI